MHSDLFGIYAAENIPHKHDITAMIWTNEEGSLYPPAMMASGIICNKYLPEDIAILQVEQVDGRFHSRLNAKSKTYEYRIYKGSKPDVFERRYVWPMEEKLDVAKMREATGHLTGTHDFMAFCGNRRMKKTTVRTIYQIEIEETEHEIRMRFTGSGFLQNMVRILTGTLVEVGRGERTPEDMEWILESRDRQQAGFLMPAKGLTLMEVKYK